MNIKLYKYEETRRTLKTTHPFLHVIWNRNFQNGCEKKSKTFVELIMDSEMMKTSTYRYLQTGILSSIVQGGSNMTGTDLCVNKLQFVPVIFEPPCT
jgi:hypothetical protein